MAEKKEQAPSVGAEDTGTKRLTAADVQQKQFRLAFRGYHEREVDEFLDQITEELARLHSDNRRLQEEVEFATATAVPTGPDVDQALRRAHERASAIVSEAEARAAALLDEARRSVASVPVAAPPGAAPPAAGPAEERFQGLVAREKEFLQRLAGLIQDHAEVVKRHVRMAGQDAPSGASPRSEPAPRSWTEPGMAPAEPEPTAAPPAPRIMDEQRSTRDTAEAEQAAPEPDRATIDERVATAEPIEPAPLVEEPPDAERWRSVPPAEPESFPASSWISGPLEQPEETSGEEPEAAAPEPEPVHEWPEQPPEAPSPGDETQPTGGADEVDDRRPAEVDRWTRPEDIAPPEPPESLPERFTSPGPPSTWSDQPSEPLPPSGPERAEFEPIPEPEHDDEPPSFEQPTLTSEPPVDEEREKRPDGEDRDRWEPDPERPPVGDRSKEDDRSLRELFWGEDDG